MTIATPTSSFETPSVGSSAAGSAGSSWTFNATAGIQRNGWAGSGSAYTPDGAQTIYLQGLNGHLGSASQVLTFPAWTFALTFSAVRRGGNLQSVRVSVDGMVVGTHTPTTSTFSSITTADFSVGAGPHTVVFSATDGTATGPP